jgi:micrococcal nuclease
MELKIVAGLYVITLLLSISTIQTQGETPGPPLSPSVYMAASTKFDYQGQVTRIIDGDTLEVDEIRVRLVGVDTPEHGEAGYAEAAEFVRSLCPVGSPAGLDIDDREPRDKYGRTLAVVHCGGVHVNRELLRRGHADVMFIPPSEFNPYSWG